MSFPRRLLNDDEEVVLDLHPHWWFLAAPSAALVAALALSVAVRAGLSPRQHRDAILIPALVLVVVALLWFVARYARWSTTNFVVTTDRLVYRSGVFAKQGKEIPLERVNDISFHQSLFERMVGSGDVVVESAGERGQEQFFKLPRPSRVQNEIYHQIEAAHQREADRTAGHRELSPLEQLEKLEELRGRGVISQAEFDAKKAQLLDRL
jgi:uncharacterized membrane protein YdbT with pleckstrin-like domain